MGAYSPLAATCETLLLDDAVKWWEKAADLNVFLRLLPSGQASIKTDMESRNRIIRKLRICFGEHRSRNITKWKHNMNWDKCTIWVMVL